MRGVFHHPALTIIHNSYYVTCESHIREWWCVELMKHQAQSQDRDTVLKINNVTRTDQEAQSTRGRIIINQKSVWQCQLYTIHNAYVAHKYHKRPVNWGIKVNRSFIAHRDTAMTSLKGVRDDDHSAIFNLAIKDKTIVSHNYGAKHAWNRKTSYN